MFQLIQQKIFISIYCFIFDLIKHIITMYSLETVLDNYRTLSHSDIQLRDQANKFLIRALQCTQIWSIAQEIITASSSTDQKLLGAQLLYQKIQSNIDQLILEQLQSLRQFIFIQLTDDTLTLPIVRKLSSGAALIAASLMLNHWPQLISDLAKFMETSPLQFRNGLILLERLPQQLRETNRIKHAIKIKIQQNLLNQNELIGSIFLLGLSIDDNIIIQLSLEALQNWINMGLPLLKLNKILQKLIQLSNFSFPSQSDSFLEQCFKIICDGMHYCSQQKCQTLEQINFSLQRQRYSSEEFHSLSIIINYIRDTKPAFLKLLDEATQINKSQIYTTIIKEILLSYSFLLMEEFGFEFIELINKTLNSNNLKLSCSTFEFWLQLGQKMIKCKEKAEIDFFFWQIIDNLLDIILHKTIFQHQSMLLQTSRGQDTIDDINLINFDQYRKQASSIIQYCYSYFTHKKKQEGSANFFKKLSDYFKIDSQKKQGIQLSIYVIKSVIGLIVHDCDQQNVINFIVYLMNEMSQQNGFPPLLILEIISLIKQGNIFIKKNQQLVLKCAEFCLGFINNELYCDNAFQSFELLMKNVNVCESVIEDLLNFYESKCIEQPLILNKILQITVNSIVKLNNKNTITNYLNRLIMRFEQKSKNTQAPLNNHILLDEIRTLLDSYQSFPLQQKQSYLPIFMKISINGIQVIYNIILDCLNQRLKWQTTQLGISVMTIKSTLRLCNNVSAQYIPITGYLQLMNLVLIIFKSNQVSFFLQYAGLLDIFHQILNKLNNFHSIIDQWLRKYLPSINFFFLNYTREYKHYINGMDPDVVNHYFTIQQSIILYDQSIYLEQIQHQEIFNLALTSMKHLNEKNLQRKVIRFLNLCITLEQVYSHKYTALLQTIFISLPNFNSGYYSDLGKIIITLFRDIDFQTKQNICCQMLQNEPYIQVDNQIRNLVGRFIAFALETKIQKHIKAAMVELSKIASKKANIDQAMHLQHKIAACKKDFLHQEQLRHTSE